MPTIDAITSIVRLARPYLSEAEARASAHAFFAQIMQIVKGAGIIATPVDEQLAHAVRFTVAAVMHLEAAPPGRSHRQRQHKQS